MLLGTVGAGEALRCAVCLLLSLARSQRVGQRLLLPSHLCNPAGMGAAHCCRTRAFPCCGAITADSPCFWWLCRNGGCTFLDTRACLAGWPNLAADPAVTAYYQLELAWYLHM